MNIRPLHDRIVIKRLEENRKTPSGLVLPTGSQEKINKGKILAIGKGRILENGQLRPLDVKIGDIVIFKDGYSIEKQIINNEELLIMSENDILGILE
ncbi:10 kDa chaperonin [Candidatus Johnevansia muelleri]|uniref:Co-chaperonin GroES n=1 Tax=Candidatus Johnevansia muelleri TaxID=1495769 RepID=A0A078KIJ7_9GAMM|nr:10 kDa chaperonin [Candidatus Evansia muelleri]